MFNILLRKKTQRTQYTQTHTKSDTQNYTQSDTQNYTQSDTQTHTKSHTQTHTTSDTQNTQSDTQNYTKSDVIELFKHNYNIHCNIKKKKQEDEDRLILLKTTNEAEELYRNILSELKNGHTKYSIQSWFIPKSIELCNTLLNERLPMFNFTYNYYPNMYYAKHYYTWEWVLIEQSKE